MPNIIRWDHHGHKIGPCLLLFRNNAIKLNRWQGFPLIPDSWQVIANLPDRGLNLLLWER